MTQFISNSKMSFILNLRPFLDIEFSDDIELLKNSDKSYIGWNPTAREPDSSIWLHRKANKLPSYFVERGALPNTIVIDPNGFLVESSSYHDRHWDVPLSVDNLATIKQYICELKSSDLTLELQDPSANIDNDVRELIGAGDKDIIFVPMQLNDDTVIVRWSDWVKDVHKFQTIVAKLAKRFPDKIFLVKNHPIGRSKKMQISGNVISGDEFHYKSCLASADKALVINSGVGLQSMAWEVPCIITGKAFYNFLGINYRATSFKELCNLVDAPLTVDTGRMYRFLYFLKYQLYSDSILIKTEKNRHRNTTDSVEYTNVRIFTENK